MKHWKRAGPAAFLAVHAAPGIAAASQAGPSDKAATPPAVASVKGVRGQSERAAVVSFGAVARQHALAPVVSRRPQLLPEPDMPPRRSVDPRFAPAAPAAAAATAL